MCCIYYFILLLVDGIWVVSTFWLWLIKLVCTHYWANFFVCVCVCVCVIVCVFISLGHIQRSGNSGSLGNCMLNLLGNCQTAFRKGCTISCSHQLCMGILIFPLSCQFVFVCPLDFSHPSECEVVFDLHLVFDFIVVFICISLMINNFSIFLCDYWSFVHPWKMSGLPRWC